MEMSEMRATCPNNETHQQFFTTAHVTQTWLVDPEGHFVSEISTDETTHGPSIDNEWTCSDCGADVVFVGECWVMRVKIRADEYGVGPLRFGTFYYMSYGGVTYGECFVFTRRGRIELCEMMGERKVASYWVSKRQLKQIIQSGGINWMSTMKQWQWEKGRG